MSTGIKFSASDRADAIRLATENPAMSAAAIAAAIGAGMTTIKKWLRAEGIRAGNVVRHGVESRPCCCGCDQLIIRRPQERPCYFQKRMFATEECRAKAAAAPRVKRPKPDPKPCARPGCDTIMTPHYRETFSKFNVRRYCCHACAGIAMTGKPKPQSQPPAPKPRWMPTVVLASAKEWPGVKRHQRFEREVWFKGAAA